MIGRRHDAMRASNEKGRASVLFRVAFAIGCVGLLCGLTFPVARLKAPSSVANPAYRFVDQRDPKAAKSANESLMITNCAYGAVRIGQRDIDPDLALFLHAMLAARFGSRLEGREVELLSFTVHQNNAASLRQTMGQMYTGLIPALMNNQKRVGCSSDDVRGGYTLDEAPAGAAPLIVAVHVLIDGEPYHGRAIFPAVEDAGRPLPETANGLNPREAAIQALVERAVARLGDAIEADLPRPAQADAPLSPQPPSASPTQDSTP